MFHIFVTGLLLVAAPAPPEPRPAAPPKVAEERDLRARVTALEEELQRMRLQAPEEPMVAVEPQPASAGSSPNLFNPTITVIGNGLYRYDDREVLTDEGRVDNHFNLREVEIDLRAPVDPFADGVLITSFESPRPNEFEVGVEEGYVLVKRLPLPLLDEPPLGLKLKVGRFRTDVGRVNRIHLHDLPQVDRPLVSDEFFGEEGYLSQGLSAQFFVPTPFDEESAVELTAQVLTGGGVAIADGPLRAPAFVGNLRWFRTIAAAHNLDLSFIFHHGRTGPDARFNANTYSTDVLYKWKPLRGGESRSFVLGGQVLYARRRFLEPRDNDGDGQPDAIEDRVTHPFGYFAFAQHQFTRALYLGTRWDDTRTILDDSIQRRAASGYLTWYATEFLRFRVGYEHRFSDVVAEDRRNSAFAELNFIFGAHPPEPFWVNR